MEPNFTSSDARSSIPRYSNLEQYKGKIEELYLHRRLSLPKVAQVLLTEDQCHASKKIRKWGWEKKNKLSDMLNVEPGLDESLQPFTVRGRTVTPVQVRSYFRRRQARAASSRYHMSMAPMLTLSDDLSTRHQFFHSINEIQLHILGPLRLPSRFYQFPTIREYADDQALQAIIVRRHAMKSISYNSFFNHFANGVLLLERGLTEGAGACFESGSRLFAEALRTPSPAFVASTLYLLLVFLDRKLDAVAEIVARNLWSLASIVLGNHHPLTIWTKLLHHYYNNADLLLKGIIATTEFTEATVGRCDEWSLSNRYALMYVGVITKGLPFEEICQRYSNMLNDFDHSFQPMERLGVNIRRAYASYLSETGHHHAAVDILAQIPNRISIDYDDKQDAGVIYAAGVDLGEYLVLDNPENVFLAENIIKEAIARAKLVLGHDASTTVWAMARLAAFYKDHGNVQKSKDEYDKIGSALDKFKLSPESPAQAGEL